MKKRYQISQEEFEMIKDIISEVLELCFYNSITVEDNIGHRMSMRKETFFETLKNRFIIKG